MKVKRITVMKTLSFNNGDEMPAIGLGTWKSDPGEVRDAVIAAIEAGYRHIDCAPIYGNEKEVGEGLKQKMDDGTVKREDLWITSKLWNDAHQKDQVEPALKQTLSDLGIEYLDLFLIHWPVVLKPEVGFPRKGDDLLSLNEVPISETWAGMEGVEQEGLTRHIGVSNFGANRIQHLMELASVKPEMNQVELHPYLQQNDLLDFCRQNGILLTAYSPLGSKDRPSILKKEDEPSLLENPVINQIADKHGCKAAQVLIAWAYQRGTAVIPKSVNPERIKQNLASKDVRLDEDDMKQIAQLDKHYRYVDGSIWTMEGSPYSMEELWA